LMVVSQVKGYRKVRWHTHETLGFGELDLPPTELLTTGYWFALDDATVDILRELGMWQSDPNQYGPNWDSLRQHVRQRDGYRCQVCGSPEIDRAHDVHHKIPFRTFSNTDQANRLDNLLTLCSNCHQRVETTVRVRSGLAGMGYVLHHLAPFFLMCDTADLGVHSDPQLTLLPALDQETGADDSVTSQVVAAPSQSNAAMFANNQAGIVLYDHIPAGIGFSLRLFELHEELLSRAQELVQACPCSDGCPSCVGPGGEQGQGGKEETLAILKILTNSNH
jgi:DEAD/DEAH box helicase domain-containing protein